MNFEEGEVILINKPYRWTSFDVVNKLKRACNIRKIGHAGTLDPLATGLIIACTGKKTKQIDTYQAAEKEYVGTLVLGKTTPSVDLETEFDGDYETAHITDNDIKAAIEKLSGTIEQIPPVFSAVKIGGTRAYTKARAGEAVEMKSRTVTVTEFEVDTTQFPSIVFRIVCSKGTYIRSIVRDFGQLLHSGAYMSSLCRTRIGDFKLTEAHTIEDFITAFGVKKP